MVAPIIGALAGPLMGLIDDLFTSDEEREAAKLKLLQMEQNGELAQIAVNMQEAKSENVFISGWRPAVGWTCTAAFAYAFVLQPFAAFIALVSGMDPALLEALPDLDIGAMMPVLLGMLGLGTLRSVEKIKGSNKNR